MDMVDPNFYRQFGQLEAKVGALELAQKEGNEKLDVLLERSARERGGRAALWKVSTASGLLGAIIVGILDWFHHIVGRH